MSGNLMDKRLPRMLTLLAQHCKSLNLMDGDFGKAINRIKVQGLGADLQGLVLEVEKDASAKLELIAMAFAAFKKAHAAAMRSDRITALHSMGEYDGTSDKCDEPIAEMQRAVTALEQLA